MNRIDELRETWEKVYKGLVKDLGNQLTIEDVACMFFELGWRAADESLIIKIVKEERARFDRTAENGKVLFYLETLRDRLGIKIK